MSTAQLTAMDVPMRWLAPPQVLTASVLTRGFWLSVLPLLFNGAGVISRPPQEIGKTVGLSDQELTQSLTELSPLLEPSEGAIVCPGIQRELSVRAKRRAAGKLGGNPALRSGSASSSATVGPNTPREVSTASRGANQSSPPAELDLFGASSLSPADRAFEQFWSAYPIKINKGGARRAFAAARGHERTEEILGAIERQKSSKRWKDGYIPNPANWLRDERWSDGASSPLALLQFEIGSFPVGFGEWLMAQPRWASRRWANYDAVEETIKLAFEDSRRRR